VAGIAALAVSLLLPPVYDANVSLLVRPAQPLATTDTSVAALTSDQISRTYAALMLEPPLLNTVSKELNLNLPADRLAKKIKVSPEPNTTILDVTVSDTNPELARDIANRLVEDFISQVRAIQQQEASTPNARSADNLVVVSPATTPDRPSSPNIPLNVALALAAGMVVGVGTALLLDYLDQSVKGDDDLLERTGMSIIGHIPYDAARNRQFGELVALVRESPSAEAYRALRTNLMFSTVDQGAKTIVITSTGAGDGKSRTVANLAIALAAAGHSTLIVDADFRHPSQHRIFSRIRNVGLSNVIVNDPAANDCITPAERVSNLFLLTSGPSPPNPSELLGSARVRELLGNLRRSYQYVVIDTPPVNPVTDASVLAAHADATILVVEPHRTTYPALKHAAETLNRVGAQALGVVMNKVRSSAGVYDYGYGYYGSPESKSGRATSVPAKAADSLS